MRPPGSPQELERRRRRAIRLLEAGETVTSVASIVGSSMSSVWRWRDMHRRRGAAGLEPIPASGRPPKLPGKDRARLVKILQRGARKAGYPTELWTLRRMAEVIERKFGVRYHPCHVWKILNGLGWSCQKPERRARERDEAEVQAWRRERWPHIKKRPAGRTQHPLPG